MNDVVRFLDLPKDKAVDLGQVLKSLNLLSNGCTYSWYKERQKNFTKFFKDEVQQMIVEVKLTADEVKKSASKSKKSKDEVKKVAIVVKYCFCADIE